MDSILVTVELDAEKVKKCMFNDNLSTTIKSENMYVFASNRKWQTIGKGKVSVHDGVTPFRRKMIFAFFGVWWKRK
jgi:hypothetical protein